MKTYLKIIALLCFLCLMLTASAQCPTGDVTLLTQEDVNEFGILYPDCTEIEGSLQIGEPATQGTVSNINNLNSLNGITYIGGDLTLGMNSPSMTLAGLSNLDSIGASLILNTGVTLNSLTGLENLQVIGGDLSVTTLGMADFTGLDNLHLVGGRVLHNFVNYTGLENLNTIGGDFPVVSDMLSFQGLNNLTSIGGDFHFGEDHYELTDFSGLENLTTIHGNFYLTGDENNIGGFNGLGGVTTIGGDFRINECYFSDFSSILENLTTVGGSLDIACSFNGALPFTNLSTVGGGIGIYAGVQSLAGLENLTDFGNSLTSSTWNLVPGEIRLKNNSVLTDISAISHLTIDTLTIINNPNLSVCGIESICNYLAQGGAATIENNAGSCNTAEDILQMCTSCPTGDVELLSQEAINEFGALYPDCTQISGNLRISVGETSDFTPLNNLTTIAGNFWIGGGFSNFVGLENLNTIGGNFSPYASDFQGLDNLTTIGGAFYVKEITQNFIGLESLSSIGGSLDFIEEHNVSSFAGLDNLSYIGGDFYIDQESDTTITSFAGLESLVTIEGSLDIAGIGAADFSGLENLSTIGIGLYVGWCDMTSFSGLENVTDFGNAPPPPLGFSGVPGEIQIGNCDLLTDISAISAFPITELLLGENNSLSVCSIESVCNYLAQGGAATIENNAAGCNTVEEVWAGCGIECPSEDVVLLSQEAVNQFGVLYSDCTELEGNLTIGTSGLHTPLSDIIDLSPLNNIATIAGDLIIDKNDSSMTLAGLVNLNMIEGSLRFSSYDSPLNFQGLNNLTSIGEDLIIYEASELENLTGLENLSSIGGDFLLDDDAITGNFIGLENLNSIGGSLVLDENTALENFVGLESLITIGGNLFLDEGAELQNFVGLESLTTIGGNLSTDGDALLYGFSGLESLTHIGGSLRIRPDNITSLNGLESLVTIEGNLQIGVTSISNSDLSSFENLSTIGGGLYISSLNVASLNGLESVTNFGNSPFATNPGEVRLARNDSLTDISAISQWAIDTLTITENPNLSVCSIQSVCEYLAQGGTATIENNAEGCNTAEEVILNCTPLLEYTIQGNVFTDTNADCLQDADETGLNDWLIKIEQDNQLPRYAYTFGDGNYIALADSGAQYTITAIPPNMLWDNVCPPSEIVSISADNPHDGVNFGANGSTLCPLLEVDVTAPLVRRCFESNYYVRYCNSGTAVAENAYVEVQLDPFFTFVDATIEGIDLGENLYSFDVGNIDVNECGSFRIDVYVDCDSTVLGQTHCMEVHIFPDSICTPALPLWDGASIEVDAQCLGDSIEFKIENIGTGDMSDSLEYIIVEEDLIWQRMNFQIDSGDDIKFYKPANGLFHRLEAEQSPGHPGNSMPSVFVEGCGENDNGEISIGFVNYYLLDEGDAFVSIDCQENVGSYDPNDKQAFPVGYGEPHYITDSTDLEYMIRFQNTGTDTAFNIVIRDVIDPHLNIETLRPGVSSHSYRYEIEGPNTAVFHFENIMLPDSNINEVASHGFIKFNIQQKENNSIGTHIMNEADIYFDFNEPIITNTVFHTVGEDFRGIVTSIITPPEVSEAGISVNVFPNPFDEYTRFEVQGETVKELQLNVYDMMGREVLEQKATHQQHITMKRNNLTPGVYVFRLMDEKQQLATGKLVVK